MDFHDLNGILLQILVTIFWVKWNFCWIANLAEIYK